ncbi:hypothetical protein [Sinosporangium album]|nr:hypothetical protein [Sinosporangium album]
MTLLHTAEQDVGHGGGTPVSGGREPCRRSRREARAPQRAARPR